MHHAESLGGRKIGRVWRFPWDNRPLNAVSVPEQQAGDQVAASPLSNTDQLRRLLQKPSKPTVALSDEFRHFGDCADGILDRHLRV
jgi:hypothetical protein